MRHARERRSFPGTVPETVTCVAPCDARAARSCRVTVVCTTRGQFSISVRTPHSCVLPGATTRVTRKDEHRSHGYPKFCMCNLREGFGLSLITLYRSACAGCETRK